ncbi:nucleophile aminohydrolase [Apodospora peruviana]|uniref:Nucleophile aminohydrolase n=1 Tax=Apodospora peruviana TaxID=516989 RepID=A0AAE0HY73_9PEZI|nr:nucleophile aminohydrolase [Apodospora peruviana]
MEDVLDYGAMVTGGDGTVDRIWKRGGKQPVAAIFIHAGAGYHSIANEKIHLEACSEAARVAMRFLRAGAPACEAVEAAIKCLEDKEVTNAGFGSNLNMDGVVECDATMVDHMGRSGACGAVPGIKNPISLARLILDASSQPLSLRRVPPNILVGMGANAFAQEHGMPITLNEHLISKNAKDRWLRWNDDLMKAEARLSSSASAPALNRYAEAEPKTPGEYDRAAASRGPGHFRDHTSAILTGTWNEGQPDSPCYAPSPPPTVENGSTARSSQLQTGSQRSSSQNGSQRTPTGMNKSADRNPLGFMSSAFQSRASHASMKRPKARKSLSDDPASLVNLASRSTGHPPSPPGNDGPSMDTYDLTNAGDLEHQTQLDGDTDKVTDTIGAIAIDLKGNIAAGSSSGGIGMKHSGRVGPAALVGVGTAVIPEDPDDNNAASVAAVTSGTGEHMATTFASAKCAERLLNGTRRGPGGRSIEELDEHTLMEAFILDDFMGHPGVKNQPSTGAIGVMAVKKERTGVYFYFAHNTDSFALASMSSTEREPLCVMSRLGEARSVAQGGRRVRID